MATQINQDVIVDHGDLLEACQAAQAWASQLRQRERKSAEETADRIDRAVAALHRQALRKAKITAS